MSSKESIQVVCRVRPPNKFEIQNSELIDFELVNNKQLKVVEKTSNRKIDHKFNFDYVFDMKTSQKQVFKVVAKPVIENVFSGLNGSILAYGQTSSGKTFTMQGVLLKKSLRGIVPRLVEEIFKFINNSPEHYEFVVKLSMLEIYMERIRDLLNPNQEKTVRIRQDPREGVKLENLAEVCVGDELEVSNIYNRGVQNRKIGRTNMNAVSSRSHMMTLI